MKKYKGLLAACLGVALVAALALAGCSSNNASSNSGSSSSDQGTESTHEAVTLQIFAANSLSKAMEEEEALYAQTHEWVTFADTQYKSSGELNELLEGGATADILISASKSKMDAAEQAGYIDASTRFDMFKNVYDRGAQFQSLIKSLK